MTAWPNSHAIGGIPLDVEDGSRVVTKVTGLDGSATIRLALEDKAQQDGQWDALPLYGARVLQVEGVIEEATTEAAHALAADLRALNLRLNEFLVVSAGRGTVSTIVRVQGGLEPEWLDDLSFTYVMTLVATDPLLYGPEAFAQTTLAASAGGAGRVWPRVWPTDWGVAPGVTPGAVAVANAGTASYFPRMRIDGPVTNPVVTLVETGDFVRFNGSIAAGQHLDINWGTPRRVTIGDNPVGMRHRVSYAGNWLAIPPGGGSIAYSADDADPAAVLSVWSYEGAWE